MLSSTKAQTGTPVPRTKVVVFRRSSSRQYIFSFIGVFACKDTFLSFRCVLLLDLPEFLCSFIRTVAVVMYPFEYQMTRSSASMAPWIQRGMSFRISLIK